ncbi:MAG: DNA polymerase III subunit beta [Lentisphaerae bacterium]|nr:DNA polymerase III subunit beta [Lentisphaerota bacterium]
MEMTINREALLRAMTPLAPLFTKSGGLKFKVEGDKLELVAGGEEVEMRTETLCGAGTPGEAVLGGRKLFDFIRALADGQSIEFRQEAGFSRVIASRSNYRFANLPLESHVSYRHVGDKTILADFTLANDAFKDLVTPVLHAVAKNDVRSWANGILFHFVGEEEVIVVATNGHMMALTKGAHGGKVTTPGLKLVVHGDAVSEMLKLATAPSGKCRFRFTDSAVRVDTGEASYKTRLLAEHFADYEKVIPVHETSVQANTADLLEAVTRASILSDKHHAVRLDIDKGQVLVSAHNEEQEEVSEEVGATTNLQQTRIAFNANYITACLKAVGTETVDIAIKNGTTSVLIMDRERPSIRQIVMPIKI